MHGRLIDADALLRDIEHYHVSDGKMQHWVEIQPTVDAVPVLRCRECKYLMFSDCYGECGAGHIGIVRPDDFCSRGIRKDDHHVDDR